MPSRIYLDYNSTTPMLPEVVEAMRPYYEQRFANPASAHRSGADARDALESARSTVAKCLGALPSEVVFTSGATEANNLAIFGLSGSPPGTLLISPVEHPSVLEPCKDLLTRGFSNETLPVDRLGKVQTDFLDRQLPSAISLISVQLANHETGTLQPVQELSKCIAGRHFHTDATQAVGKIPVHFHQLGVTTLACSGHKFHGPKGIGVLLVNKFVRLKPLLYGGHQQQGVRPGTEPVPLAVGLATALRLACEQMATRQECCQKLRERFLGILREHADPVVINGDPEHGLAHTLNLSFSGCPSDLLLIRLDLAGIDCSTGSACSSGSLLPSPVLQAMQCPTEILQSSMRFSLSPLLSMDQAEEAARRIAHEVQCLRRKLQATLHS